MASFQIQEEEMESLEAIYSSDFIRLDQSNFIITVKPSSQTDLLPSKDTYNNCTLQFNLPVNYPTETCPVYHIRCLFLNDQEITELSQRFEESFVLGEVTIYQWVELTREYINEKIALLVTDENTSSLLIDDTSFEVVNDKDDEEDKEKERDEYIYKQDQSTVNQHSSSVVFSHGQPLTDRKSTFQAHLTTVHSIEQVRQALSKLKENRKVSLATHNIVAYRFEDSTKGGALIQDCDDDGENAAGSRLLHLLQIMNVRNTLVVVSRWYGGVQLGPDRFKHINNVARILIQESAEKGTSSERDVPSHSKRDVPSHSKRDVPSHSKRDVPSHSKRDVPSHSKRTVKDTSSKRTNRHT